MTAIYAFTSKERNLGFLAADDIDSEGERVDKIALIDKQYAVTCHGKGFVVKAAECMEAFELYDNCKVYRSLEETINEIFQITKIFSEKHFISYEKQWKEGKMSEKEWKVDVLNASAILVILDGISKDLYQVDQIYLFPPDRIDLNPPIKKLNDNRLCLFSFAELANCKPSLPLTDKILSSPFKYIEQKISDDQKVVSTIGKLGTHVLFNGEKIEINSCFNSARDYALSITKTKY